MGLRTPGQRLFVPVGFSFSDFLASWTPVVIGVNIVVGMKS